MRASVLYRYINIIKIFKEKIIFLHILQNHCSLWTNNAGLFGLELIELFNNFERVSALNLLRGADIRSKAF